MHRDMIKFRFGRAFYWPYNKALLITVCFLVPLHYALNFIYGMVQNIIIYNKWLARMPFCRWQHIKWWTLCL